MCFLKRWYNYCSVHAVINLEQLTQTVDGKTIRDLQVSLNDGKVSCGGLPARYE